MKKLLKACYQLIFDRSIRIFCGKLYGIFWIEKLKEMISTFWDYNGKLFSKIENTYLKHLPLLRFVRQIFLKVPHDMFLRQSQNSVTMGNNFEILEQEELTNYISGI